MTKPDRTGRIIGSAINSEDVLKGFNIMLEDLKPLNPAIEKIIAEKKLK